MTEGVGGSSAQAELSELSGRTGFTAITVPERLERIEKAHRLMVEQGIDALYLDASTNLFYFTGLRFWATERLHGAII
ncbi:MAG: aminopeptidase P family protein, partial [Acidiferrobacteraceae bacterium]|nr:aminopeptidase P family protein [Acidiferrobacteraceae bacterium]